MRYLSLDVETSGLSPTLNTLMEIALVYEDGSERPVEELPYFHVKLAPNRLTVDRFSTPWFERQITECLAATPQRNYTPGAYVTYETAVYLLQMWASGQRLEGEKVTFAGKNVAGFDLPFLRQLGELPFKPHHRSIDPAPLYAVKEDATMPSLETCLERAGGLTPEGLHGALGDARDIIRLLRYKGL